MEESQKIHVDDLLIKLGIDDKSKPKRGRRVNSVLNSRDTFNESNGGSQLFQNRYGWNRSEADIAPATKTGNATDKDQQYLNLRKDLLKETELVSKLRKLMMDTSHPSLYEYKSFPLIKHVWRWVKLLVKQYIASTKKN